jgi:hypothetical protein
LEAPAPKEQEGRSTKKRCLEAAVVAKQHLTESPASSLRRPEPRRQAEAPIRQPVVVPFHNGPPVRPQEETCMPAALPPHMPPFPPRRNNQDVVRSQQPGREAPVPPPPRGGGRIVVQHHHDDHPRLRPIVVAAAAVVAVEDITDDDDDKEEVEELQPRLKVIVNEEPQHQQQTTDSWTLTSRTILVCWAVVVVAVILAVVVPRAQQQPIMVKGDQKVTTASTFAARLLLKGIMFLVQVVTNFLWWRIKDWLGLLQKYPSSTLGGTVAVVAAAGMYAAGMAYLRQVRHRREAELRQALHLREAELRRRVVATRFQVYEALKKYGRPVWSEFVFARIVFQEQCLELEQHEMFRREIWSIIEEEARSDPCIVVVDHEVAVPGGIDRPGQSWEYLDHPPHITLPSSSF